MRGQLERLTGVLCPSVTADPAVTRWFAGKQHDDLLQALRIVIDGSLPELVRTSVLQSLQDAGCDLCIEFVQGGMKCGIQLKSHYDISQRDFHTHTLAQIQDSRRHGLQRLYVMLAGDLTDQSHVQKVRGLHARISQMNDPYVEVVPPERVWRLVGPRPPHYAHPYVMPNDWVGRRAEMDVLDEWLERDETPVCCMVAMGGSGKSSLAWEWAKTHVEPNQQVLNLRHVFQWSFYEGEISFERFLQSLCTYLGVSPKPDPLAAVSRHVESNRILLILDGFERMLRYYAGADAAFREEKRDAELLDHERQCADLGVTRLLTSLAANSTAKTLIGTRLLPEELDDAAACQTMDIEGLAPSDAVVFLRARGISGLNHELEDAARAYGFHPFSLERLVAALRYDPEIPNDIRQAAKHEIAGGLKRRRKHILEQAYSTLPAGTAQLLSALAANRASVQMETVHLLAGHSGVEDLSAALRRLQQDRWICWDQDRNTLDLHPIVRRYAYAQLEKREAVHELLAEHLASKARGVVIQQNTAEPSGRLRRYAQPGAVRAERWPARPAEVELLVELYYQLVKAGRSNAALSLYREHLAGQLYDRQGLYGVCVELLDTLIDADSGTLRPASAASAVQVWMLNELANAYAAVGQARQATHIYRDAIDMCRNDRLGEAEAVIWANLAYQQVNLGELQEAYSNLRKSLDGCQRGGDRVNEAIGYQDLARIWAYQGSFSRAEQASGAAERVATHLPLGQRPELLLFFRGLAALLSGQIRTVLNERVKNTVDRAMRSTRLT